MESVIANFSNLLQNKKDNFQISNLNILDDWNLIFNNIQQKGSFSFLNVILSSYTDLLNQKRNYFQDIPFEAIHHWYQEVLIDQEKHFKEGQNFNVFYLLKEKFGFGIQETMHSKLIKFLLDTKETHGQGNLFLLDFLKKLNIETPDNGIWNVSAEAGRIDLLITRNYPESVIVIENKSNWANDQSNQLYRYWYQAIYSKTKRCDEAFYRSNVGKYQIIYLVPNTDKVLEEHSISKPKHDPQNIYQNLPKKVPMEIVIITFNEHIQEWLDGCINALPENNHRIREYIIQYKSLCNNL